MRNYLPQMYDKHSFERGRRVSQKEREEKNLIDESYAYGELDPEIFTTIYMKVINSLAHSLLPFLSFFLSSSLPPSLPHVPSLTHLHIGSGNLRKV